MPRQLTSAEVADIKAQEAAFSAAAKLTEAKWPELVKQWRELARQEIDECIKLKKYKTGQLTQQFPMLNSKSGKIEWDEKLQLQKNELGVLVLTTRKYECKVYELNLSVFKTHKYKDEKSLCQLVSRCVESWGVVGHRWEGQKLQIWSTPKPTPLRNMDWNC